MSHYVRVRDWDGTDPDVDSEPVIFTVWYKKGAALVCDEVT